jgi:biopolymer transport protein ExbD
MAGGAAQENGDDVISGINVTPLVDVTLVLLIIMMVTAKVIVAQGMPMDLPRASQENAQQMPITFSVDVTGDGGIYVNKVQLEGAAALERAAKEAKEQEPELRAVIRADSSVEHAYVMQVLESLKKAGVGKIAFAVVPEAEP